MKNSLDQALFVGARTGISLHAAPAPLQVKQNSKVQSKRRIVTVNLNQPGRLRAADVWSLLNVGRATFYTGVSSGRYPKPDGYDGRMPFWKTSTILAVLTR